MNRKREKYIKILKLQECSQTWLPSRMKDRFNPLSGTWLYIRQGQPFTSNGPHEILLIINWATPPKVKFNKHLMLYKVNENYLYRKFTSFINKEQIIAPTRPISTPTINVSTIASNIMKKSRLSTRHKWTNSSNFNKPMQATMIIALFFIFV